MKARLKGPPVRASNKSWWIPFFPESAGANYYAGQKTSPKCCAAALCTNKADNGKDLTFHSFPTDSQRTCRLECENETI